MLHVYARSSIYIVGSHLISPGDLASYADINSRISDSPLPPEAFFSFCLYTHLSYLRPCPSLYTFRYPSDSAPIFVPSPICSVSDSLRILGDPTGRRSQLRYARLLLLLFHWRNFAYPSTKNFLFFFYCYPQTIFKKITNKNVATNQFLFLIFFIFLVFEIREEF